MYARRIPYGLEIFPMQYMYLRFSQKEPIFYLFNIICIITLPNMTTILPVRICDHVINLPS